MKSLDPLVLALVAFACERSPTIDRGAASGSAGSSSESGGSGGSSEVPGGAPRYHPPEGFEDCKHAEVKADCKDGWCKLPPSCFVMGTPLGTPHRGANTENQVAVTLTHHIEMQQTEMTRGVLRDTTGNVTDPAPGCDADDCPVVSLSWWDLVQLANRASEKRGLKACYEAEGCTGSFGKDLVCAGFRDPDLSVYDCEGYRLPTRAEFEYAERAGTISTYYSGDTVVGNVDHCIEDPNLGKIAWYCHNSEGKVHPAKGKEPNAFGLYDLLGNVSEWNNDEDWIRSSSGGENPDGQVGARSERTYLGCVYHSQPVICRPTNTFGGSWGDRSEALGFRLVRTLDP